MPTVTTSSCKVKYISACRAVKEHMATFWNLLNFLGMNKGSRRLFKVITWLPYIS